ncbi:hypothetical protein [Phaeodactylibacter luteus]|uniref:Fibrobacter succinogenes major paralogous domain-containing protein n=1 Tax=Phaeodactylibacter luteus TaxID=1564516 RepID=A0A5C6RFX2_9BACT|nr:hypothetical protein [Phaeodactylibacter luteus]TXB61318.1 hypothetical protein FRY97_19730 [Phaeodactylibacter luteus]
MTYSLILKKNWIALALLPIVGFAQVKVGDNPTVIDQSALLEMESSTQGFLPPRMTEAQMNAIVSPAEGLMVFCTDCMPKGLRLYDGTDWASLSPSGPETTVSMDCSINGFTGGDLIEGEALSGQTFSLTVANNSFTDASLNFATSDLTLSGVGGISVTSVSPASATLNGAGSSQLVTYTLGGTPASEGTLSVAVDIAGLLSCQESATVFDASTGGTGIVSSYGEPGCSAPAFSAELIQGVDATGTTLTLYADVTQAGAYSLSLTENGVTFAGSGTFAATGCQPIVLTATGTPTSSGTFTWTANTTPAGSATAEVLSPTTGGTGVVGSYGQPDCDAAAFSGALVEGVDATGTTLTLYANVTQTGTWSLSLTENGVAFSGSGTFAATGCQPIVLTASGTPMSSGTYTWTSNTMPVASATADVEDPSSGGTVIVSSYGEPDCDAPAFSAALTEGVDATGTTLTLYADVAQAGTYSLSLTENGVTFAGSGTFAATGCQPIVLTASGTPLADGSFTWTSSTTPEASATTDVLSESSNGTSVVSAYGGPGCSGGTGSITGTMTQGATVSGVTMELYAEVTQTGTWSLEATENGVTFSGSGTFAATGCQLITLTGSGTPAASGDFTWTTNSMPSGSAMADIDFDPTSFSVGSGSFSGRTCFDISLSNDNTNDCGNLASRLSQQSDFTDPETHTQSYTFTPSGTVSNVRFAYINTNGSVVTTISGGNTGNNISTPVVATVNYSTTLNTDALGLTAANPLTADIYVLYNDGASNNGTDRQLKITVEVKDCACCGAYVAPGVWKTFMCHNLGAANTNADPFTPSWEINGGYWQWGRKGPNPALWLNTNTANFAHGPTGPTESESNNAAITDWGGILLNNHSWQGGVKRPNDPCPAGFRVPSGDELYGLYTYNAQISVSDTWSSSVTNYTTGRMYGPSLFLPAAGQRDRNNGALIRRGEQGSYWSADVRLDDFNAFCLSVRESTVYAYTYQPRSFGFSIRCIAQ